MKVGHTYGDKRMSISKQAADSNKKSSECSACGGLGYGVAPGPCQPCGGTGKAQKPSQQKSGKN